MWQLLNTGTRSLILLKATLRRLRLGLLTEFLIAYWFGLFRESGSWSNKTASTRLDRSAARISAADHQEVGAVVAGC
jgi:uncharacterized membrane protein YraQ (UPF0718 family)